MTQTAIPITLHFDPNTLITRVNRDRCGFLADTDIDALAQHPTGRLTQVLVRAGACRFVCAAQDVEHLERCLTAGGDYVRDVSFPVTGGSITL